MKRTRITIGILSIIVILSILFFLVGQTGEVQVNLKGDGTLKADRYSIPLYPGDTKTCIVSLYNTSSDAYIIRTFLESVSNIKYDIDKPIVIISKGERIDVEVSVSVAKEVAPGTYVAKIYIDKETYK